MTDKNRDNRVVRAVHASLVSFELYSIQRREAAFREGYPPDRSDPALPTANETLVILRDIELIAVARIVDLETALAALEPKHALLRPLASAAPSTRGG